MAEENSDFNSVIESLLNMFSDVLNKDAIITVAESCGGDLNLAVDAIMKITNDDNTIPDLENDAKSENNEPIINKSPAIQNIDAISSSKIIQNPSQSDTKESSLSLSYASSVAQEPSNYLCAPFQRYGAPSKVPNKLSPMKVDWNDQIRRVIENHNKGSRTLILMRGVPGSGKTELAKKIIEMLIGGTFVNFRTHICSTDDYFMSRGQYFFNKNNLSEAHAWNQNRAILAMSQGLSPLIIDNTNIELWEMKPYVCSAVQNGYIIEVIEPNTTWARNPHQLVQKNIHNVPYSTIKRMLDHYKTNVTGESLLKHFNLKYPSDRIPPVLRSMPAFELAESTSSTIAKQSSNNLTIRSEEICYDNLPVQGTPQYIQPNVHGVPQNIQENIEPTNTVISAQQNQNIQENIEPTNTVISAQHNQNIQESIQATSNVIHAPSNVVETVGQTLPLEFPPETKYNEKSEVDHDFEIIEDYHSSPIETITLNDVDDNVNLGEQYLEVQKQLEEIEKVEQEWENGENWEEDPQTSTVDIEKERNLNCPKPPRSQENLINAVSNVRDWQEICLFMPPWQNKTIKPDITTQIPVETTTSSTSMDKDDFDHVTPNLKVISATVRDINQYHISTKKEKIPDKRKLDKATMITEEELLQDTSCKTCSDNERHFRLLRKLFKKLNKAALRDIYDKCLGDINWAVGIVLDGVTSNQIETVADEDISDDDDSDEICTCTSALNPVQDLNPPPQTEEVSQQDIMPAVAEPLPVPKKVSKRDVTLSDASVELKRQIEKNVVIADSHYSEHCLKIMRFRRGYTEKVLDEAQPSTSQTQDVAEAVVSDDEEESNASMDEVEKTVNINLGREFVAELDRLFGRTDMFYPSSLVPKINIPISLLNELNALWMESLMNQWDQHDKQRDQMLKEDEEFARALALKEEELAMPGRGDKETEVLDFKEIMDMDLALSIYQRDVAEWRNKEPNDLAARLSRDKLYSLFPEVQKEVLAELLMAHENSFQSTVEALLVSTGRADLLKEKNGVNKFVMNAEMERQAKILEEERKALSEVEWPLLSKSEVPDMATVNGYRDEAVRHLQSRNTNIQKAKVYLNRGMIPVATYYRELAEFHKLKFEQSHSLAAASLMQMHAAHCPDTATIDLHYLRVAEAKESLDLFIDTHIQKLKSNQGRGARHHNLYFITGRGRHSNGGPRVKPAVKKRLTERRLICSEVNPGLLSTRVCADDVLTHEIA